MALFDVTYGEPKQLDPDYLSNEKHIKALGNKLHTRRFQRVIQTIDEGIESVVQYGERIDTSNLSWTKAGALFGHKSVQPKRNIDHLWNSIASVMGFTEDALKTLGSLLRWRIAERETENWMLYRRETDLIDNDTGKPILVSEYWIKKDENF